MSRHPIQVDVADPQRYVPVSRRLIRRVLRRALVRGGVQRARISLALVDDAVMRRLNRRFLGRDYPTDVLSFPLSDPGAAVLAGEIVVSAQMAWRRTRRWGRPAEEELCRYVVHGALHLAGRDDARPAQAQAMHRLEDAILAECGFETAFGDDRRAPGRRPAFRVGPRPEAGAGRRR